MAISIWNSHYLSPCLCTLLVMLPPISQPVLEEPGKIQMIKRFDSITNFRARRKFWSSSFLVQNIKIYYLLSLLQLMQMRATSKDHWEQGAMQPRGEGKRAIGKISVSLVHFLLLRIYFGIPLLHKINCIRPPKPI